MGVVLPKGFVRRSAVGVSTTLTNTTRNDSNALDGSSSSANTADKGSRYQAEVMDFSIGSIAMSDVCGMLDERERERNLNNEKIRYPRPSSSISQSKSPISTSSKEYIVFDPGFGVRGGFLKLDGPFGYIEWVTEPWDATRLPKNLATTYAKLEFAIIYPWEHLQTRVSG